MVKCKRGRPPTVSKKVSDRAYTSEVKPYSNGGAYIPVPKCLVGKKVRVILLD